jgi:alanine racemase
MTDTSSRPTYLEVDLARLKNNLDNIRAHVAPAKVMVVLKGNAYGHGVDGVAPFISPYADYLGVALVEEGVHLRELGIHKPILVMGGTLPAQIPWFIQHDLTLVASSPDLLEAAEAAARAAEAKLKVHLKIDTGMERIGMHEYEAKDFLQKAAACSHLQIEGIYSHFANADSADLSHARLQMERFEGVLNFYDQNRLPRPALCHMANSSAVLQLPESYFDMVRPGILFYGVYPGPTVARAIEVKRALTWRSQVAFTKITKAGRPVSYGSTWQSSTPVRVVTIPCGYADGYFRRMTNQALVIVNGKKYPQVGRICMDQFMVNLGEDMGQVGDAVVLLGEGITPEDLARWAGTNEYEVLTNISARVPRLFVQ